MKRTRQGSTDEGEPAAKRACLDPGPCPFLDLVAEMRVLEIRQWLDVPARIMLTATCKALREEDRDIWPHWRGPLRHHWDIFRAAPEKRLRARAFIHDMVRLGALCWPAYAAFAVDAASYNVTVMHAALPTQMAAQVYMNKRGAPWIRVGTMRNIVAKQFGLSSPDKGPATRACATAVNLRTLCTWIDAMKAARKDTYCRRMPACPPFST